MGTKDLTITVETIIKAPIERVWELWTGPEHLVNWNFASDEWYCPSAKNDLRHGGEFNWRMEARDKSTGFDFMGTYDEIAPYKRIKSILGDGRKIEITFSSMGESTQIMETFEAENMNSLELQQTGWQAILDNFRKYAESITP